MSDKDSENPHRKTSDMNFGWALEDLKRGHKVCRSGWNGRDMWIHLQTPDRNSKMSLPYIYMYTATGDLVPWLASQTDILAEDWDRSTYQEVPRD